MPKKTKEAKKFDKLKKLDKKKLVKVYRNKQTKHYLAELEEY